MHTQIQTWLTIVLLASAAAHGRASTGDEPFRLIAKQPVPVRWAGGAQKLPLTFDRIPQRAVYDDAVQLTALRNEAESFQLSLGGGLNASDTVEDVTFEQLVHTNGEDRLGRNAIELSIVGYVRDRRRDREHPDVLFPVGAFNDFANGYAYTLWATIYVPHGAEPGRYQGEVQIDLMTTKGARSVRVPVSLHVYDYALPKDVPVATQLFSFNANSAELWFGFEDTAARLTYTTEKVYPRYVRNRLSPGTFVPDATPLYMRTKPYETGGPAGRYRNFDGTIGDGTAFSIDQTRDFSITLWVNPASGAAGTFLSQWGGGARGMKWHVNGNGETRLLFSTQATGRSFDGPAAEVPPDRWTHLAVTVRNPAGPETVVTAYRDGEQVDKRTIPGVKPSGRGLHLGSGYRAGVDPYTGGLDEVRVHAGVLDHDAVRRDRQRSEQDPQAVVFMESFDEGYSPGRVGKDYLEHWGDYWRDHGLHLNNVPIPRKWDKQEIQQFFDRMSPVIERNGWWPYLYVRLPFDEATHGRRAEINQQFARVLTETAPQALRHQTFGGGLRGHAVDEVLEPHAGLVDIWCSVPGHYLKQFPDNEAWLRTRVREHGESLSWYIHHNIPVGNGYKEHYSAMDLRGFFWRMYQYDVRMCAMWSTTNWDRGAGKHEDRDLERLDRGFAITPSTALGVGNGLLFYPGENADAPILDSIRARIIRDAIEDYQYFQAIARRHQATDDRTAAALHERITGAEKTYVRFAPTVDISPAALEQLRIDIARYLESIGDR